VVLACRGWGWARLSASLFLVVLGLVLPLGAVMTRNYRVGGDVVLSSSHAGFNFYIGNHKGADGAYQYHQGIREDPMHEGEDARVLASRKAGRDLRSSEASAYWFSEAANSFRDDRLGWLRLEAIKLARFVNAEEVMDTWSVDFLAEHAWLLHAAFLSYALLLPGGLVGFIIFFRRGPRAHLINLLILATTFSVVVFYVFGRYRMPVVPLFAITSAAAVSEFVCWIRDREYEKPILVILGVALATGGELVPIRGNTSPAEYRAAELCNLAVLYEDSNEPALARQEYDRALKASPQFSRALASLGVLDFAEGKTASAGRFFRDAIQADGLNATAHYGLAGVYYREGKRQDAILEMKAAINARPAYFEAYRDLGATLLETRDFAQARGVLEEALRLNPGSETVWKNLGTCYYQLRDFEKARASWQKALEMTDSPEERARLLRNLSLPGVVRKP
jgi:Tfp pilus assembly protein PilF